MVKYSTKFNNNNNLNPREDMLALLKGLLEEE
jgi:hypothetical protein